MEYTKAFLLSVAIIVGERDVASSREISIAAHIEEWTRKKKKKLLESSWGLAQDLGLRGTARYSVIINGTF
jgi:hypothetical protein